MLKEIMPKEAGDFNEGLMELGETICLPKGMPLCDKCPLQEYCVAQKQGLTNEIPVRINKIKRKKEEKTIFILLYQDKVAIQKREEKGLLAGMYEFPNVDGNLPQEEIKRFLEKKFQVQAIKIRKMKNHKHIFSHIEWKMKGYQIEVKQENSQFLWVEKEKLKKQYAIPGAFASFQKEMNI